MRELKNIYYLRGGDGEGDRDSVDEDFIFLGLSGSDSELEEAEESDLPPLTCFGEGETELSDCSLSADESSSLLAPRLAGGVL